MITEYEQDKMRMLGEVVHHLTSLMVEELGGDTADIGLQAQAAGVQLATLDALFAIREGTEWRGLTDPREICRTLLRDCGLGDPES